MVHFNDDWIYNQSQKKIVYFIVMIILYFLCQPIDKWIYAATKNVDQEVKKWAHFLLFWQQKMFH